MRATSDTGAIPIACHDISPHNLPESARESWRALIDRAAEPNPFLDPDILLPAVANLESGADVRLLVASDEEHWLACLPVRRRPSWRALLLPCLTSWTGEHGFLDTPLVEREGLVDAADALVSGGGGWPPRFLSVEALAAGGPVDAALRSAALRHGAPSIEYEHSERGALLRRLDGDYLAGHISAKRRREHRRTRRGLEADLGGPAVLVDRAGDAGAVARFLELESAGWKGREGTALATDPGRDRFFRAACANLAARGALHVLELTTDPPGAAPAAAMCAIRAGDTIFLWKIAYDQRLARHAPGIQLLADTAGWFHEATDAAAVDSCAAADNSMIKTLWPDRRAMCVLVLPSRGVLGLATRGGMHVVRRRRRRLMHA